MSQLMEERKSKYVEVKVEDPAPTASRSQPPHPSPPSIDPAYVKRLERDEQKTIATMCMAICFLLTLTIIYLIMGFAYPQSPKFGLNSLSISRFNISAASEISANWDVGFLARNPNAVWRYSYDHVVLSVLYKNQLVSEEAVFPEIYLPMKAKKSYTAKAVAMAKRIADNQLADALVRDLSDGMVAFTVRLLESNMGDYRITDLNVTCANINVGFKANHLGSYDGMMLAPNNTDPDQVYASCSSDIPMI